MRKRYLCCFLLVVVMILSACIAGSNHVSTVEINRFVEVTKIVEVTRIVKETVVETPASPYRFLLGVKQGITLPLPRTSHTATRLNDDRILLVGGSDGADEHYARVEIYDPATGLLTPVTPLNTPRHGHSATLLQDNRILVVGGYNFYQQWLQDAEVYDPSRNTWTIVPPLYSHGVQHSATLLLDGRVLVVGGCIASGICTERVEIFDPRTDSWTEAPPLAAYRASHTAVLLNDGRILVAGGGGPNGIPTDGDALLYDPYTNSWAVTGSMVFNATQAQALKLLDGRVLVVGGLNISENPTPTAGAEIYDPIHNTWTSAASLARPRYAHILVMLADGQVITMEGAWEYDYPANHPNGHPWNASSFLQEIEEYDPLLDRWFVVGEMPQPITYAAAAFLPDGRLWVSGGGAGHAILTAWAETWMISPQCNCP